MKKWKFRDFLIFVSLDILIKIVKGYGIKFLGLKGIETEIALIMIFFISLLLAYFVILIYDYLKMDPIMIETLKERMEQSKEMQEHSSATRKIVQIKKLGNNKILLIALICIDPIVTGLYYREGHHKWDGLRGKTIFLFVVSLAVCTISFSFIFHLLATAFGWIFDLVKMILN